MQIQFSLVGVSANQRLTANEVADMIGVSLASFRCSVSRGEGPTRHYGPKTGKPTYVASEVGAWITERVIRRSKSYPRGRPSAVKRAA